MSPLPLGVALVTLLCVLASGPSYAQRAMAHPMPRPVAAKPAAPQHPNAPPANGH